MSARHPAEHLPASEERAAERAAGLPICCRSGRQTYRETNGAQLSWLAWLTGEGLEAATSTCMHTQPNFARTSIAAASSRPARKSSGQNTGVRLGPSWRVFSYRAPGVIDIGADGPLPRWRSESPRPHALNNQRTNASDFMMSEHRYKAWHLQKQDQAVEHTFWVDQDQSAGGPPQCCRHSKQLCNKHMVAGNR